MNNPENRWDLPKQQFLVDWANEDKKSAGDCWRCCIAAVVGVPAAEVPHFLQQDFDSRGTDDWRDVDDRTQRWLNERGFAVARINGYLSFDYLQSDIDVPVICGGPTPRSQKMHQHHAVVYVGNKMVYDPHPSNAGLTAITERWLILPVKTAAGTPTTAAVQQSQQPA